MAIFLIIFTIGVLVLLAWVVFKMDELDELQEELDKYSVHLDERANKLAQWEQELIQWSKEEK
jgi:cell division protein FtsL